MINLKYLFLFDNYLDYKLRKLIENVLEEVFLLNSDTYCNILETIKEVNEFIVNQLEYEEKIMCAIDYPNRYDHIEKHNELRKELTLIKSEIQDSVEIMNDRLCYVIEWLSLHIIDSDNPLSTYLNKHKINLNTLTSI